MIEKFIWFEYNVEQHNKGGDLTLSEGSGWDNIRKISVKFTIIALWADILSDGWHRIPSKKSGVTKTTRHAHTIGKRWSISFRPPFHYLGFNFCEIFLLWKCRNCVRPISACDARWQVKILIWQRRINLCKSSSLKSLIGVMESVACFEFFHFVLNLSTKKTMKINLSSAQNVSQRLHWLIRFECLS